LSTLDMNVDTAQLEVAINIDSNSVFTFQQK